MDYPNITWLHWKFDFYASKAQQVNCGGEQFSTAIKSVVEGKYE